MGFSDRLWARCSVSKPNNSRVVMNDDDPSYSQARAVAAMMGYATISLIQRHLLLGYRQATLLVARLIAEGIVEARPDQKGRRKVR